MMKKSLKRWLAMLLAVLMVMGTLPTSAWAARRADEVAEEPVIGAGEGVTDVLRKDDGELPVDPTDPDAPPADLTGIKDHVTSSSADAKGTNMFTVVFDALDAESTFTVAVLPNFRLDRANGQMPTAFAEGAPSTYLNSSADLGGSWAAYMTKFPLVAIPHNKSETYTGKTFVLKRDGTMELGGEPMASIAGVGKSQAGTIENVTDNLVTWYENNKGKQIYDENKKLLSNPTTLPFKVYMVFGDNSMVSVPIDLPLTTPLKVEILNKQSEVTDTGEGTGFNYPYSIAEVEGPSYAVVKVTNQSGDTLTNIKVNLLRDVIHTTNTDDGWSVTLIREDKGGDSANDTLLGTLTVGHFYGFEGTSPWGEYTIDSLANNDSAYIPIIAPTDTSPDVGLGDLGGTISRVSARAFYAELSGDMPAQVWSNYTAKATARVNGKDESASDDGGILWADGFEFTPKVVFVDSTGRRLDPDKGEYDGTALTVSSGKLVSNGDVGPEDRTVQVGVDKKPLHWDTSAKCYTMEGTASSSDVVYVDGKNTWKTLTRGITEVTLYTVTVHDVPGGMAGADTSTEKAKGAYTWDTTQSKRVDYNYYPTGTAVGVYAKTPNGGFDGWTNAEDNLPSGLSAGLSSTVGQNGHLEINGSNVHVYANYNLKTITIVTTYNGNDPGDNTVLGAANRNSDHVFKIDIKNGSNASVASATLDSGGNYTLTNLTEQTVETPWTTTLEGGTYTLEVNGQFVATINTDNLPTVGDYNYVVEIAGVIPKIANTNEERCTMTLPDDLNPTRDTRGDVSVDGKNTPNTNGNIVLYYPTTTKIAVSGGVAAGVNFANLKYNDREISAESADDGEGNVVWATNEGAAGELYNVSGDNALVATFGAATGSAAITVTLNTDDNPYTGLTMQLSTSASAVAGAVALTEDGATGVYKADGIAPGTYHVFNGTQYTEKSVTVTASGTPATAKVKYFTLTIDVDTTVDSGAKAGQGIGTVTTGQAKTAVNYLENTQVDIKAEPTPSSNFDFKEWEVIDRKGTAPSGATAKVTMTTETSLKAIFQKSRFDTELDLKLNGSPVAAVDADITGVTFKVGTKSYTAAYDTGTKRWVAEQVTKVGDDLGTWTISTRSGDYTVASVGDKDVAAAPAQMYLYSIDVEKGQYGNDDDHAPYIDTDGTTRVIVKKGAVDLEPNPKTGYDRKEWLNAAEGASALPDGVTVANDTVTLGDAYAPTGTGLKLKPTFTYTATINPTRAGVTGTFNLPAGSTVQVKSGSTTVNATKQSNNQWKASGLTPNATYTILVNGYESDRTFSDSTTNMTRDVEIYLVSAVSANATMGSATLTVGDKPVYLPHGATNATGWTITASANTGYRLKGGEGNKQWKLTAGASYGALDSDTATPTTLKVTAIAGDVTATAYFTQQWKVTSHVTNSTANPKSSATLTGATSGDGKTEGTKSTKTIDAGEVVEVTFTGAAGESLNAWALTSGSGKWCATNSSTDSDWTTWAAGAVPTGPSFFFKPTQNSTITATIKTKEYPIKVRVYLDDELLTKDSTAINSLKLGTATINKTTAWHASTDTVEGYWEVSLVPNNAAGYNLQTDVTGTLKATGQTLKFGINEGEAGNLEVSVKYWTVTVETGGNGDGRVAGDSRNASTDYAAATAKTSDDFIVENGTALTWTTPKIATNYQFKEWQKDGAASPPPTSATDTLTYKAIFEKKTGVVKVQVDLNDSKNDKSSDAGAANDLHTVTLYQVVDGGTDKTVETKTGKSGEYSFTVPFNQGEGAYYAVVVKKDAATNADTYTTEKDIIFTTADANGATKSKTADYYTLTVDTTQESGGNKIGGVAQSLSTISGNPTDVGPISAIYVKDKPVNIKAASHDGRYTFKAWEVVSNKGTAPTGAAPTVPMTEETYLRATFKKDYYNTYLNLTVNGTKWGTKGDSDDNIKNVQLVTANNNSNDVPNVTVAYDGTAKVWKAEGVANTYTAPYWKVTTVDNGTYWLKADTDDLSNDVSLADATVNWHMFGVKVPETKPDGCAAASVKGSSANSTTSPRVVMPLGNATAAQTRVDGYTFVNWKLPDSTANASVNGSTVTLSDGYANTVDLVVTPTYTFEVPVELRYSKTNGNLVGGQTVAVTGATVANKGSTNTGEFKVSGMTPGTTYKVVVNGYESELVLTKAMASTTTAQVVVLHKIDAVADPSGAATSGYPKVNNAALVYVPNNAELSNATPAVTATQGTAASGYRWLTGTGETLWSVTKGDDIAAINNATGVITTLTDKKVTEDIRVTAHGKKQWDVTKAAADVLTTDAPRSKVEFTTAGITGDTATLDEGTIIGITATPSANQQLQGWKIEGGEGKLYSAASCAADTEITTPATHTGSTVYVKAVTANAKVTATFEDRRYPITVQVKLDNDTWANSGVKIKLNSNGTEQTVDAATGATSFSMTAATYNVYANGVDTGKTVTVNTGATSDSVVVNYYTVKIQAVPAGDTNKENKVNFNGQAAKTSDSTVVLAKTGAGVSINAKAYDGASDTVHYRFVNWTADVTGGTLGNSGNDATTTYTLPDETVLTAKTGDDFNITDGITLTANFKKQFKVTVQQGTRPTSSISPQVKVTGDAGANAWKTSVYVDEGGTVDLQTTGSLAGRHFQSWTKDTGEGKFWNLTDDTKYDAGKGLRKASADNATNPNNLNGFNPTADTVIDLNLWLEAEVQDFGWTYERGVCKDPNPAGVKEFTWVNNDAKEITKVTVKGTGTNTYAETELTAGADYKLEGGKIILQNSYIDDPSVVKGDYAITVTYTLGTTDNEVANLTIEKPFYIKVTPYKLTRVDIGVPTKTTYPGDPDASLTMNINADDNKANKAAYLESENSHLAKAISKSDLTFDWFWSATKPDQGVMPAATLTAYEEGTLPSGWTRITGTTTFTGDGAGGYTAVPTFTANATDHQALKGNYVFAVVKATTTGEGTVITNSILVDFDAKVTVRENGSSVTAADADGYSVYLWPADSADAFAPASAIPTEYNADDNTYDTKDSALTAGKTYHVYVLETEDMDKTAAGNYVRLTSGSNPVTVTRTTADDAVADYYTVSVTDMSAISTFTHATTTSGSAAETFDSYPTFTATTGKGATITTTANTKGVLKGTAVTVKANALSGKSVGWEQDYTLAWQDKEGTEANFTDAASKLTQNSTNAVSTGYGYTNSLSKQVDFTGRLTQNTYTISGDVKDVDGKSFAANGGSIQSATLTVGAVTYTSTPTANGGHDSKVSFTVPKGAYTLSAAPKDGTTMKGYTKPAGSTPTTQDPIALDEVTAGGTGKFTIFVAKTALTMTVADEHDDDDDTPPHTETSSNPAADVGPAEHTENWIYDNYNDAWTKTVTVTNDGNTELAVTLVLQKKVKQADGTWPATWTDTIFSDTVALGAGGADTNGIKFAGLESSFTLGIDAANKSKSFTVSVRAGLENADDVKYHFYFTSKDGRDGIANPANGPKMYYDLGINIEPVTIGRVTTVLDEATNTFRVQHHWLQEDALRYNPTGNLNALYNEGGTAHTWAAETIETDNTKRTSMSELVKQGQSVDGAPAAKDDADIFYRWYVVDPDAQVSLDKTTGELTPANGKSVTEVTGSATENGTAFKPGDDHYGKKLYLVAVGRRNAQSAVMTPDETQFHEDPVPIPYPAIITLWENKVGGSGNERNQVAEANKDDYKVWVWDAANGDFPADPAAANSKAIPANPVAADGKVSYKTDVVLYPDHTYQVWTSAARKLGTEEYYLRNTGITIGSVEQNKKNVEYYLVDVADTTLDQNDYEGKLGTIPDDSAVFYNDADLTGDLEAPTAKIPAKGATAATLDVKGTYVLNDTTVTFGFGARELDYDLIWSGGMPAATDKPAVTSPSRTLLYKNAPNAAVATQLKLNLYDVNAWVVGQGVVSSVSMTMVDAGKTYTFLTDTTGYTAGADEVALLGMKGNTAVTTINTGNYATFRLPKYEGTAGAAGYKTAATYDSAYTLTGYYATHGDSSTLHAPGTDFYKGITTNDAYDIVLQGDSYDMRVKDNVPTNTQKDIAGAGSTYGDGLYDQNKLDGVKNTDGTLNQIITLNYNYNAAQDIELTVTNETRQPEDDDNLLYIYDVTFTQTKAEGGIAVSATATNDFAGGQVERMGRNTDAKKLTLTIPAGLAVGSYDYQAEFTYLSTDGAAGTGAKVTYNLKVIVRPLPFTAVTVTDELAADGVTKTGKLTIDEYTVTRKATVGETADVAILDKPNATTADPDAETALRQDTDYGYQWINAPVSMSYADVKAALSWTNGTLTVSETDGVKKCTDASSTTKTYTPDDNDSGRNIFLVIYGKDNAAAADNTGRRNAEAFALSPAYTNTYKGMVALKVDGAEKRAEADADSTDLANKPNHGDGYEVYFVSKDDNSEKEAKWTKVGTEWAYVADLVPNTSGYTVKISRARDDAAKVTLPGVTISGADVATTILPAKSNVAEAPFFTVNTVNFTKADYKPGTGETLALAFGPKVVFKGTAAEIASGTPVLENQEISAESSMGWSIDYLLDWQMDANNATATAGFAFPADNSKDVSSAKDQASGETGYAHGAVTAKTFIGGRLDQKTYTITGSIVGDVEVTSVTLTGGTGNKVYAPAGDTISANITDGNGWTDTNHNNSHDEGDTVTFTVVKGTYTITGYEKTGTTIRKVTVDGGTTGGTTRNTNKLEEVKNDTRTFIIHLEPAGAKLKVTDAEDPAHAATSTDEADHKVADNNDGAHYYYKQLTTGGDVFTLELHNPGNVDLKLAAPEVYELPTGTDYSDIQAALTGKTALTNLTVAKDGHTVITFAGLPAANADVKIGAGVTAGVNAVAAGTATVGADVFNKDDAIYVVKFASSYVEQDGTATGTTKTGPTVYYVLDLKVEPLPIKEVKAERLSNGNLRLKDYALTPAANDGLDNVLVDHDRDGGATTAPVSAKTAGLVEGDFSFVWYSAPTGVSVDSSDFALDASGVKLTAGGTAKGLKLGTQANNQKLYTPSDAEQGLNFYLVAYRSAETANASEFAVSEAVYAQVTVAMKAYRTGTSTELGDVNISTGEGDNKQTSNDGTVTVTGVADDANVIPFKATMTDITAAGSADDPTTAKWYFVDWAVKLLDNTELDKNSADTPVATPVGTDRLAMNYTATEKSTVIGYFDLLPEMTYKNGALAGGYVIGNDADEVEANRTLKYAHNDGSGNVKIYIKPENDGKSTFGGTWAGRTEVELGFADFDSVNGKTGSSMKFGEDGEYVLSRNNLIKTYLKSGSTYVITFYDMEKGTKAGDGGYEGYDRSVTLRITAGDFNVTARAKDADDQAAGNQGGTVRLYTAEPADGSGFKKTDIQKTSGGFIQAEAKPEPGYRFVKWTVLTKEDDPAVLNGGDMTPENGNTPVVSFAPEGEGAIIEATFEKAPFIPQADAKTSVYYGDDTLQATDGKLVVSVTKDATAGVTQAFSYDLATEAELTAFLNGASRPANVYTKDSVEVVPGDATQNTNVAPAWLLLEADGADDTKVSFSVKPGEAAKGVNVAKTNNGGTLADVDNELVVYLKVTETNTDESKLVPVTIDIMTSQLKIHTAGTDANEATLGGKTQAQYDGEAYKAKYVAANSSDGTKVSEDGEIIHGTAVEPAMFEYLTLVNEKNAADVFVAQGTPNANTAAGDQTSADGTVGSKGKWTFTPANHSGAGNGPTTNSNPYTFTFTYDTGVEAEQWNYVGESIDITFPVLRPARSLMFADAVANAADLEKGTEYSEVKTPADYDQATATAAPTELAYTADTFRTGEGLTYLDKEPTYTVKLQRIGSLDNITLTVDPDAPKPVQGFAVPTQAELNAIAAKLDADGKETDFQLTLAAIRGNVWVGEHYIRFKLTGKDDQGADVTAYYTLSLTMAPKLITALDVTVTDPDAEVTSVTGTTDKGDVDNKVQDIKKNVPIEDVEVVWGPAADRPDNKNTDVTVKVKVNENYEYAPEETIKPNTALTVAEKVAGGTTTNRPVPAPTVDRTTDVLVTITQGIPYLMHDDVKVGSDPADTTGPQVLDRRNHQPTVKVGDADLGSYQINLGAYGGNVYDVKWTIVPDQDLDKTVLGIGAVLRDLDGNELTWNEATGDIAMDGKKSFLLDLNAVDTSKAGQYNFKLKAEGTAKDGDPDSGPIVSYYEFWLTITQPSSPGGFVETCPCKVLYHIGSHGVTADATIEDVAEKNRPSKVPGVTALDGYVFRGWSLTNPATLKNGEKPVIVDPKTVEAKGETMIFYAVIVERPFHSHYVIGYPNGNFGPADNINRASVATIIARAILPDFVEGADYGNPGNYSDVSGHWGESAIAYCSKFGVFKGYTDGTFRPDQPISRQEFATVIARLDGELAAGDIPFDDIDQAGGWALNGIYTSYEKGWVNGYTDGTFKPLNNIRRDEAVKVFNAYLNRGVDADGLSELHEYIHTGVASNNTENGVDEYMTWPDVPKDHWAYYEIIEAANDHQFTPDFDTELGYTLPEHWEKCWINERWRYGNGPSPSGGSAAVVSAGFQLWLH